MRFWGPSPGPVGPGPRGVRGWVPEFPEEYLGPDASVSADPNNFPKFRAHSAAILSAAGVEARNLSRQLKNWVLAPARGARFQQWAYAVDLGNVSLKKSAARMAPGPPPRMRS